jgi:hypothetical protein
VIRINTLFSRPFDRKPSRASTRRI